MFLKSLFRRLLCIPVACLALAGGAWAQKAPIFVLNSLDATVSVVDRGSGIPDDVRNQLFRPFFTTKQNGTGLGLASSRAIVEEHDGTIGFDNMAGGGTRFWFRLPAAAGAS